MSDAFYKSSFSLNYLTLMYDGDQLTVYSCWQRRSQNEAEEVMASGVTDGGQGVRRPPGKLNVKNGAPSEISWTVEYKSASTIFGNPLVLTF